MALALPLALLLLWTLFITAIFAAIPPLPIAGIAPQYASPFLVTVWILSAYLFISLTIRWRSNSIHRPEHTRVIFEASRYGPTARTDVSREAAEIRATSSTGPAFRVVGAALLILAATQLTSLIPILPWATTLPWWLTLMASGCASVVGFYAWARGDEDDFARHSFIRTPEMSKAAIREHLAAAAAWVTLIQLPRLVVAQFVVLILAAASWSDPQPSEFYSGHLQWEGPLSTFTISLDIMRAAISQHPFAVGLAIFAPIMIYDLCVRRVVTSTAVTNGLLELPYGSSGDFTLYLRSF